MSVPMLDRIAGAPISWGVDGSPGWGHLMDPERVMAEMAELGLRATELGPDGWLGSSVDEVLDRLDRHGLDLVGGFVATILHRPDLLDAELASFERQARTLAAGGARLAVLGVTSDLPGYDVQVHLDDEAWAHLLHGMERLVAVAERCGLTVATHPHWGMAVEDQHDVDRLVADATTGFCLDTGHLALAGVDMTALVAVAADRIHHVHLKDVDATMAREVRDGERRFRQATIDGLFRPLGEGDVDIAGVVAALEQHDFQGWYVLEQDCALDRDPPPGEGPVLDAATSLAYLRRLATEVDDA